MFTVFVLLKLCAEVALLSLAGQGALWLLLGHRADGNLVYQLLGVVSSPVLRLVAWCSPSRWSRRVVIGLASLSLVLLWLMATVGKVWVCLEGGAGTCR